MNQLRAEFWEMVRNTQRMEILTKQKIKKKPNVGFLPLISILDKRKQGNENKLKLLYDILLIHDDLGIIRLSTSHFDNKGYKCKVVRNGLEGLEELRKGVPKLILLDLMLPDITGYDICRALKRHPKYREIPVFICTLMSGSEVERFIEEAGADGYFSLPLDFSVIDDALKQIHDKSEHIDDFPDFDDELNQIDEDKKQLDEIRRWKKNNYPKSRIYDINFFISDILEELSCFLPYQAEIKHKLFENSLSDISRNILSDLRDIRKNFDSVNKFILILKLAEIKIESFMKKEALNEVAIDRQYLPEIFNEHLLEYSLKDSLPILKPFTILYLMLLGIMSRVFDNFMRFKRFPLFRESNQFPIDEIFKKLFDI